MVKQGVSSETTALLFIEREKKKEFCRFNDSPWGQLFLLPVSVGQIKQHPYWKRAHTILTQP